MRADASKRAGAAPSGKAGRLQISIRFLLVLLLSPELMGRARVGVRERVRGDRSGRRQRHRHGRALTRRALHGQLAAVKFSEPLGDDQAQARSLLLVILPVELHVGTDAADLLGGKAPAAVGD